MASSVAPMTSSSTIIPRAAVSVVVRASCSTDTVLADTAVPGNPSFILVQRGKEPNKGLWSLPGGKLEAGETTLEGGQRELHEECRLHPKTLSWYPDGAICVTDSIHYHDDDSPDDCKNTIAFHYVIAQCFATATSELPLVASDDAADAGWFTMEQVQEKIDDGATTLGVLKVLQRAERLYQAGVLSEE